MDGTEYTLPITVAGRALPFDRRGRWERYKNGFRRVAVWLCSVLTVCLGYDTLIQLVSSGEAMSLMGVPLVVAGAVLTALYPVSEHKRALRDLQTRWYDEQADKPRLLSGVRIDLYDEYVVRTDLRSTVQLYYRDLTAVCETADGFLLQAGGRELIINSGDLTAEQTTAVARLLRQNASAVYRLKKDAASGLSEPLPVPVLTNTDTILSRGSITLARPMLAERYRQDRMGAITRWILPMTAVLGCTLSCWVSLFDVFAVDLLLLAGGSMALGVLLTVLGSLFGKRKTAVQLVITRDGIGGYANGVSDFLVWSRIRVGTTAYGLWLTFPDDLPLCIPWRCLEHPEAVQQLFNTQFR